jgi:hypothetical protein
MGVPETEMSSHKASEPIPDENRSSENQDAATLRDSDDNKAARQKSEGSDIEIPKESVETDEDVKPFEPPDGGFRAWLCVFGSFLLQFSSFGYVNA